MAVSTTQEVLKAIAKMSDFNVDIQACPRFHISATDAYLYRARCTKCYSQLDLDSSVVYGNFTKEFMDFCVIHRHETVQEDEVIGRKFR